MHDEGVILDGRLKRLGTHERVFNRPQGHALALDLCRGFPPDLCGAQDERPRRINRRQQNGKDSDGDHDFNQREGGRVTRTCCARHGLLPATCLPCRSITKAGHLPHVICRFHLTTVAPSRLPAGELGRKSRMLILETTGLSPEEP